MDDTFNTNALSEEDLAVLRAFDAMDLKDWEVENPETSALKSTGTLTQQDVSGQPVPADTLSPEEMLALFAGEVDEDMITIQQALRQLEPDDQLDPAHLQTLQRTAHKIKGTAGAIGCTAIPTIAHHLEELIKLILEGTVVPFIGLNALVQTVHALELTLNSFFTYGQESNIPLTELEEEYKALTIDIQAGSPHKYPTPAPMQAPGNTSLDISSNSRARLSREESLPEEEGEGEEEEADTLIPEEREYSPDASLAVSQAGSSLQGDSYVQAGGKEPVPFVRIELHRLEQLMLHTEQLAELSAPLENAQMEVEKALQELHTAQARLRYLETLLSAPLAAKVPGQADNDERPTSSLVARILDESAERTGHSYQRSAPIRPLSSGQRDTYSHAGRKEKLKSQFDQPGPLKLEESPGWDTLEINRFTESDVLIHSFNEAIADVTTASSQLRIAFAQLSTITSKYMVQANDVRNDTLLLRLAPLSTLIPSIERAVKMSALAQQRRVQFEVEGAATEIDQDILKELKHPLLQLVRTCVAHSLPPTKQSENAGYTDRAERIWLHIRASGNEVTIEVGFSLVVGGSGLDEIQEAIRRLNGSISARRNALGGISFYLRLPRSQGSVHGLLVRVGSHRVVVPFSYIQRIDDGKNTGRSLTEPPASLNTLLGFPPEPTRPQSRESFFPKQETDALLTPPEEQGLPSIYGQAGHQEGDQTASTPARPVLILQPGLSSLTVQVDEVLGDVKLVVKPLAPHLRRQGIAGAAIDGMGNVLFMVDLPELLRRQEMRQTGIETAQNDNKRSLRQTQKTILIADDSVYIRQSLLQTLSSAGYRVEAARDGIEALERLLAHPPHVLLLDMEMPNLNGYELLGIIRIHPELAAVKIAMLTSRSSEKHQERARELGAHAYLTKPCSQETLLETIQTLLTN